MNGIIFIVGIFSIFLLSKNISGQEHVFRPGLILNFNGIHVDGEDEYYWDGNNGTIWGAGGTSYGAFVSCNIKKNIVGKFEIRYIRKGGLYEFIRDNGMQGFENLKLKYIEIPLLIGFEGKTKKRNFCFETGLSYANLISNDLFFNNDYQRSSTPNADNFKDIDISWIIDFKYHNNRFKDLLIGFRFAHSIISIHDVYRLYNMNYGIELNYVLFNKK